MKNILAFFIGCLIALGLFGATEIFFRINQETQWLTPVQKQHPPGVVPDEKLSLDLYNSFKKNKVFQWRPFLTVEEGRVVEKSEREKVAIGGYMPCCVFLKAEPKAQKFYVEAFAKESQQKIYIAHFTLDDFNRRATPTVKNPKSNILMFGDSYTLGEAVDDQYAGSYQLAKLRPDTQVLNFGLAGGSPNEFLYELQNNPAKRIGGIPEAPTTVIYSYMDNHLERLTCRSRCLRPPHDWVKDRPYYIFEDNRLQFKGFFDTDRPVRNFFYSLINASATLRFFNVIWPLRFSEEHYDLFAEVILEAQKESLRKFKSADFYLVLYPGFSRVYGRQLREACEKRGIKVLDYSNVDMNLATGGVPEVFGDGHPSPQAQFIFANLLNRDLPR